MSASSNETPKENAGINGYSSILQRTGLLFLQIAVSKNS